jgi:hypothetical protein
VISKSTARALCSSAVNPTTRAVLAISTIWMTADLISRVLLFLKSSEFGSPFSGSHGARHMAGNLQVGEPIKLVTFDPRVAFRGGTDVNPANQKLLALVTGKPDRSLMRSTSCSRSSRSALDQMNMR